MRSFVESDIYETLRRITKIDTSIANIINHRAKAIVLNKELIPDLKIVPKLFKEATVLSAVNAVNIGDILLIKLSPEFNLPDCLPFIKYSKDGKAKVLVNVTKYLSETPDKDTGSITYKIDAKKLCAMIVPAYVNLKMDNNAFPGVSVLQPAAMLWSRLFNKILIRKMSINSTPERYEAFVYFGMKFFLRYYMQAPDKIVDDICMSSLKNGKSYVIEYMESKIEELQLDPYESFESFCTTLFNNEVSRIRGMRIGAADEVINVSFYIREFQKTYTETALMALSAFPYFIWVMYGAYIKAGICFDRSFQDILTYDDKEVIRMFNTLFKSV